MATPAEIESGKAVGGVATGHHVLTVAEVATWDAPDTSPKLTATAHFHAGQRVRARNINPVAHTRLPRYVRGKIGTIDRDHGIFVFPDTNALFAGEKPQHVYSVSFGASEMWGAGRC